MKNLTLFIIFMISTISQADISRYDFQVQKINESELAQQYITALDQTMQLIEQIYSDLNVGEQLFLVNSRINKIRNHITYLPKKAVYFLF